MLALVLGAILGPPVDFIYFAAEHRAEIQVPFSLHGACKDGASVFPEIGVLLEEVVADGTPVEPRDMEVTSIDEYIELVVRPGPGFSYLMPLDELESVGTDSLHLTRFVLTAVPRSLAITYRIRCANGSSSGRFVTRGRRLPVPLVRLFHQSHEK